MSETYIIHKPFKDFNYWFKRESWHTFSVISLTDLDAAEITLDEMQLSDLPSDVISDFDAYKEYRPEYKVGVRCKLADTSVLKDEYIDLLAGAILIRTYNNRKSDPDTGIAQINNALTWLLQTDFFTAPASTQYHEAFKGGLLTHCIKVYNAALDLHVTDWFNSVSVDSLTICCLMHDWCKIGYYEPYMKNVKNDSTGKWEQVEAYKYNQIGVSLGHGATSMYLAGRVVRLSPEEALAIRWHMGEYNVANNEMNELHNANVKYPLVQLIQFADRLSITEYNM